MGFLQFEKELQEFFEALDKIQSVEHCQKSIAKAVSRIADRIRLAKAHVVVDIPTTKLRQAKAFDYDLYDSGIKPTSKSTVFTYRDIDGSLTAISLYPIGEKYSEEEEKVLGTLLQQAYVRYSQTVANVLLDRVLYSDLDTGAATLSALMRLAGMYIATKQLAGYVVVFFNIHNFKYANKVFRYEEGDKILRKYVKTVLTKIGSSEILARLGGDNFVALIRKENSQAFVDFIHDVRLSHSDGEKEKKFVFGATAGISELEAVNSPRELMMRASIAYQAARRQGAGTTCVFSKEIAQKIMERQAILSNFRFALEKREFVIYYQPKVNFKNKTIYGAEALIRWFRNGKLIPPMEFIPALEQEGSVTALDYYVLEEVCRFLSNRIKAGKKPVRISVNFSRKHLEEEDLIEHIVSVIDKYGVDHQYVEIELTESEDYQDFDVLNQVVSGLKNHNIGTSMDDFGTGFSSLNMIKKIPLNVIKIDKSFIPLESEYSMKSNDTTMFNCLVDMLNKLGKEIIAEGVETPAQLQYLENAGCKIVQGYVFDKPLSEADFVERLEKGYPDLKD